MIGLFIWTIVFLFTGVFIGYAIGSYSENAKTRRTKSYETGKER